MGVYEVTDLKRNVTDVLCDFQIMDLMQDHMNETQQTNFNYDFIDLGIAFEYLYENNYSITKKYEIDLAI